MRLIHKIIYAVFLCALLFLFMISCNGQTDISKVEPSETRKNRVGGPFENSEFMYIGMPTEIASIDTSKGWNQNGQKLLITGTIYKPDGKTPAPGVILYYYHTDINGFYSEGKGVDERVKRHGYIRGWVKSDADGKYSIYTIRPAPYPNSNYPGHIHPSIKEPNGINEYYIDEFEFDDDPLLTSKERKKRSRRGGSGILNLLVDGDLLVAERDIILGLNIPDYPMADSRSNVSGRQIGEDCPSFTPFHSWGPDQGTRTCPVCKYGRYHGILYFVGDHPNWDEIKEWLLFLEEQSTLRGKYLKVYFVYGKEETDLLKKIGKELKLGKLALTSVPSFEDGSSEVIEQKINPNVENTIVIYKNRKVIDKYIDLKPTEENKDKIINLLDQSKGAFFELEEPAHKN